MFRRSWWMNILNKYKYAVETRCWSDIALAKSDALSLLSVQQWHQPDRRIWVKTISLLVILTFIFPYLTWALDVQNYSGMNTILFKQRPLEIPKKFGSTKHVLQHGEKMVVHIQDLHCNYEVQKNIAGIIHELARKHDLRLLTVEGASLPINTTKLRSFPVKKVRDDVSDYFVRQGKLSGAEYYAITSEYPMALEGIETAELYARNKRSVEFILNDEGQGYCLDLRDVLNAFKPDIYSSALLAFDEKRIAYREGRISVIKYCHWLRKYAKKLKLNINPFPNFIAYTKSRDAMFSPLIDADDLFREVDRLDQVIREYFYTKPRQRELDDQLQRLDIIEKLLSISASPEELVVFRQERHAFQVQTFVDFIRRQKAEDGLELDPEVFMLDGYLNAAMDFYRVADKRSEHLAENTLARMRKHKADITTLVTGGYHTEHVLAALKARGVSYISIKPKITQQDVVNPYFSLLRSHLTPLEKLLSQNQKIFTLEPFLPKMADPNKIPNEVTDLNARERTFSRLVELFLTAKAVTHHFLKNKLGVELERSVRQTIAAYPANSQAVQLVEGQIKTHPNQAISFKLKVPDERKVLAVRTAGNRNLPVSEADALQVAEFTNEKLAFVDEGKAVDVQAKLDAVPVWQGWISQISSLFQPVSLVGQNAILVKPIRVVMKAAVAGLAMVWFGHALMPDASLWLISSIFGAIGGLSVFAVYLPRLYYFFKLFSRPPPGTSDDQIVPIRDALQEIESELRRANRLPENYQTPVIYFLNQQPLLFSTLFTGLKVGQGSINAIRLHPNFLSLPRWAQRSILKHEIYEARGKGHLRATWAEYGDVASALMQGVLRITAIRSKQTYTRATEKERETVLDTIRQEMRKNLYFYKHRFRQGLRPVKPEFLLEFDGADKRLTEDMSGINPDRVFHEGLIKDENDGSFWIVKRKQSNIPGMTDRKIKNRPRKEHLAYLLLRSVANVAPIRRMSRQQVRSLDLEDDPKDYYLTRVVTTGNIKTSELAQTDTAQAFARNFVANILMRKWDPHLFNMGFAHGLPLLLDHDETLPIDFLSTSSEDFQKFISLFLENMLLLTIRGLSDHHREMGISILSMLKQKKQSDRLSILLDIVRDFGVGKALAAAEMLTPENLRAAVLACKTIGNIREMALEAGYRGEELEEIVRYFSETQATLGKDVDYFWNFLMDQDAGLKKLDDQVITRVSDETDVKDAKSAFRANLSSVVTHWWQMSLLPQRTRMFVRDWVRQKGITWLAAGLFVLVLVSDLAWQSVLLGGFTYAALSLVHFILIGGKWIYVRTYPNRLRAINDFLSLLPGTRALLEKGTVINDVGPGFPMVTTSELNAFVKSVNPANKVVAAETPGQVPAFVVRSKAKDEFALFNKKGKLIDVYAKKGAIIKRAYLIRKRFQRVFHKSQATGEVNPYFEVQANPLAKEQAEGIEVKAADWGTGIQAGIKLCFNVLYMYPQQEADILKRMGRDLDEGGYLLAGHNINTEGGAIYFQVYQKIKGKLKPIAAMMLANGVWHTASLRNISLAKTGKMLKEFYWISRHRLNRDSQNLKMDLRVAAAPHVLDIEYATSAQTIVNSSVFKTQGKLSETVAAAAAHAKRESPDLAENTLPHEERNQHLKNKIRWGGVYRMQANGATRPEFFNQPGFWGIAQSVLMFFFTLPRWLAYLFQSEWRREVVASRLNRIRLPDGRLEEVVKTMALETLAKHMQQPIGIVQNYLINTARSVDLLLVKNSMTLHQYGPFAHARAGVARTGDKAIWLGENTIVNQEITDQDIARLLLEEAQHIIAPQASHKIIQHDDILFRKLKRIATSVREAPGHTFCERDISAAGPDKTELIRNIKKQMVAKGRDHVVPWGRIDLTEMTIEKSKTGIDIVTLVQEYDEEMGSIEYRQFFLQADRLVGYGSSFHWHGSSQVLWHMFAGERGADAKGVKGRFAQLYQDRLRIIQDRLGGTMQEVEVPYDQVSNADAIRYGTVVFYMKLGFEPKDQALRPFYQKMMKKLETDNRLQKSELKRLAASDWILASANQLIYNQKPVRRVQRKKEKIRQYKRVTSDKKQREIVNAIQEGLRNNLLPYRDAFLAGIQAANPQYELSPEEAEYKLDSEINSLSSQEVFQHGLIRDETDSEGVYWILKKRARAKHEADTREEINIPQQERLAYLLSQGIANLTEIRLLSEEEARALRIKGDYSEYYLTRVVRSEGNDVKAFAQQDPAQAYSADFVFKIWTRKSDQHIKNLGFIQNTPVTFDHDETLVQERYPNTRRGFQHFLNNFFYHKIILMAVHSIETDSVFGIGYGDNMQFINLARDICLKTEVADRTQAMQELISKFGFGQGLIAAEGLNPKIMRETIRKIKSLTTIREMAMQAGYTGDELETTVAFAEENQKRLGRDVNEAWKRMIGEDLGFAQLDVERESPDAALVEVLSHEERNAELRKVLKDGIVYRIDSRGRVRRELYRGGNVAHLPRPNIYSVKAASEVRDQLRRLRTTRGVLETAVRKISLEKLARRTGRSVAEVQTQLIFIVREVPILIVGGRVTLHPQGPVAHARVGISRTGDRAIWIGERLFVSRESPYRATHPITDEDIAQLLLEEAQHILDPTAAHDVIEHDAVLMDKIKSTARQFGEIPGDEMCIRDAAVLPEYGVGDSFWKEGRLYEVLEVTDEGYIVEDMRTGDETFVESIPIKLREKDLTGFDYSMVETKETKRKYIWHQYTNKAYLVLQQLHRYEVSENNKWRLYLNPASANFNVLVQIVKEIAGSFPEALEFKYLTETTPEMNAVLRTPELSKFVVNFSSREIAEQFYAALRIHPDYASIRGLGPALVSEKLDDIVSIAQGHKAIRAKQAGAGDIGGLMPWLKALLVERWQWMSADTYNRWAWAIEAAPMGIAGIAATSIAVWTGFLDPTVGITTLALTAIRLAWGLFPILHVIPKKDGYKSFTKTDWINVGISVVLAAVNIVFSFAPVGVWGVLAFGLGSHWLTNWVLKPKQKQLPVEVVQEVKTGISDRQINRSLLKTRPLPLKMMQFLFTPRLQLRPWLKPLRLFGGMVLGLVKVAGYLYLSIRSLRAKPGTDTATISQVRKYQLVLPDAISAQKLNPEHIRIQARGNVFGSYEYEKGELNIFVPQVLANQLEAGKLDRFLFDVIVWTQAAKFNNEVWKDVDPALPTRQTTVRYQQLPQRILKNLLRFSTLLPVGMTRAWHGFWLKRHPVQYLQVQLMQASVESDMAKQLLASGSALRQAYVRFSQQPDTTGAGNFVNHLLAQLRTQQQNITSLQQAGKPAEAEYRKTELLHSVNTLNSLLRTMQSLQGRPIGNKLDGIYNTPFGEQRLWISPLIRNSQLGAYLDVLNFLGIQVDRKDLKQRRRPKRTNKNAA